MRWVFPSLSALSLLLACAAAALWVYSYRSTKEFYFALKLQPLFEERADGVTGYVLQTDWNASFMRGRLAVVQHYQARNDVDPYTSPEGFPLDHGLVTQYEQGWSREIDEAARATPTHGHQAEAPEIRYHDYPTNLAGRYGFDWNWGPIPQSGAAVHGNSDGYRGVWFPVWAPLALLCILPAAWLVRFGRTRRRVARHLCPACGYDLRATPERCPECGNVADRA